MIRTNQKNHISSFQEPQVKEIDSLIEELQSEHDEESKQLHSILKNLKYGSKQIQPSKNDAVLIFGNTGSGKTSLFAFLCGLDLVVNVIDYDAVLEYKDPSNKKYGQIGSNFIESETFIPNKLSFENLDVWDCPGFQDSRGEDIDVVNSYFMHKIIAGSQGLKFIFLFDGQIFEQSGFEQKGKSIKQIFEIVYQLTKNSKIDFESNLMFIFSKTTKPLNIYKNKLDSFLDQIVQSPNYTNQLKHNFNFNDYKQFYSRLKQVKVNLFPLADEDMQGQQYGSEQQRKQLWSQIEKLNYYYRKDLDIPFALSSQEQIKIIQKYSYNQVCDTFTAICQGISSTFKVFDQNQTMQADRILQEYQNSQDPSNLKTNLDVFIFMKSKLILPLIDMIKQQKLCTNNSLIQNTQKQIEIIQFFLSEVYDSILSNLNLSIKLNTDLQFGNSETEYGLTMIQNALIYQKKFIEQNNILIQMQKKQKEQEILIHSLNQQINQQKCQIEQNTAQLKEVNNQIKLSQQKLIEAQQFQKQQEEQIKSIKDEISQKQNQLEESKQKLEQINQQYTSYSQEIETLSEKVRKSSIQLEKERKRNRDLQLQRAQIELNSEYKKQKDQQDQEQKNQGFNLFLNIFTTVAQIALTKKFKVPKI
ncbi:hypothetical protein ABPG74_000548 [Tetrahymena malaccensis]